jgi:serine/threonine-protein kinase
VAGAERIGVPPRYLCPSLLRERRVIEVLDRLQSALAERYRLHIGSDGLPAELGRGGMATVYLADDLRHGRQVAIKVIHPQLAGHGYQPDRFLREIRFAARLSHPQILPLYDSGSADGFLFYVMPYAGGETLRGRLTRLGTLPVAEAVRIARALAGALEYAHREGVVHRDIKPENILLQQDEPVLADFGVARAIRAAVRAAGEVITASGVAVGTPAYMSPEQATADATLDGRSDQYSLACVTYEMLTGQPPFAGGSAREIMRRHAMEDPRPPRVYRPTIPRGVETAVLRALAKEPADRFPATTDFGNALQRALDQPDTEWGTGPLPPPRRSVAVLPFLVLGADAETAWFGDGMADELIDALSRVDGLAVASRGAAFALRGEPHDARSAGSLLGVDAVLEGSVRRSGDRIRISTTLASAADGRVMWAGRYDRQLADVFSIQEEIAGQIVATLRGTLLGALGDPVPQRYTRSITAYAHYLRGRYAWNQRTAESAVEAIHHFEAAIAEDPGFALAYTGLADCYALEVDYRGMPVREGLERARIEAEKALALDEGLAEAHTSLAWVKFIYDWDWSAAGREFRRAIELNPRYAIARQWYAWLLMALGQTDDAVAQGRLAAELDPASASIRRGLGWLLYYAGRLGDAEEQARQAVVINPTASETQRILGLILMRQGRLDDADDAFREALRLAPEDTYTFAALGWTAVLRGKPEEARERIAALQLKRAVSYVSPVPFVLLHAALGNVEEAFEWLQRAHEERRGWLAYLRVEPALAPLRGAARLDELMARMHL